MTNTTDHTDSTDYGTAEGTGYRPTVLGALPADAPARSTYQPPAHGGWNTGTHLRPWLVTRRNEGATPADIADELVAAGWDADAAASAAMGSLRRSDRNALLWFSLCWSAGLSAVGFTTGAHELLSDGADLTMAALGLTMAIALAPIAAVLARAARRCEDRSRFALWSPERRTWFATLATCTAVVGVLRLLVYVYGVVSAVVGARTGSLEATDLFQVGITVTVAVPLFLWSYTEWRRSDVVISGLRHDEADEAA